LGLLLMGRVVLEDCSEDDIEDALFEVFRLEC